MKIFIASRVIIGMTIEKYIESLLPIYYDNKCHISSCIKFAKSKTKFQISSGPFTFNFAARATFAVFK